MTPAAHQPLSLDKQIQLEQLKHSNLQLQLELMRAQLELAKLSPNVQITVTCVPILRGGFIFCSIIMACLSSHPMSRSQILIFCLCFGENFKRSFPPTILAITLHINALELLTVVVTVKLWATHLQGLNVELNSDNTACIAANNNKSLSNVYMQCCLRELWLILFVDNISLVIHHVPSKENSIADRSAVTTRIFSQDDLLTIMRSPMNS